MANNDDSDNNIKNAGLYPPAAAIQTTADRFAASAAVAPTPAEGFGSKIDAHERAAKEQEAHAATCKSVSGWLDAFCKEIVGQLIFDSRAQLGLEYDRITATDPQRKTQADVLPCLVVSCAVRLDESMFRPQRKIFLEVIAGEKEKTIVLGSLLQFEREWMLQEDYANFMKPDAVKRRIDKIVEEREARNLRMQQQRENFKYNVNMPYQDAHFAEYAWPLTDLLTYKSRDMAEYSKKEEEEKKQMIEFLKNEAAYASDMEKRNKDKKNE